MRAKPKILLYSFGLLALLFAVLAQTSQDNGQAGVLLKSARASAIPSTGGSFAKVRRSTFKSRVLGDYTYAPSQMAKSLATQGSFGGNSWFQFTPKGKTPAPLVILFHGSGRTGLSMIDMWLETAQTHDVILLAPNARGRSWVMSDLTLTGLQNMLSVVGEQRQIDTTQIYLFGHSNGGGFVTLLLNQFEGPWRGGATHGGFASSDNITSPQNAKPFRIYLGEKDHIFGETSAEETARAMAHAGHSVTLQMIPDHTHWFYEIGPQIARDSWAWFNGLRNTES